MGKIRLVGQWTGCARLYPRCVGSLLSTSFVPLRDRILFHLTDFSFDRQSPRIPQLHRRPHGQIRWDGRGGKGLSYLWWFGTCGHELSEVGGCAKEDCGRSLEGRWRRWILEQPWESCLMAAIGLCLYFVVLYQIIVNSRVPRCSIQSYLLTPNLPWSSDHD